MSGKRSDFLWIVQTIMIQHQESTVGWTGVAGDAVAASHRIPPQMTARAAALAFCSVNIEGFSGEAKSEVPHWMAILHEPSQADYSIDS